MKNLFLALAIILTCQCPQAFSANANKDKHDTCAHTLHKQLEVSESGRDADVLPQFQEAFQMLYGPEGLTKKLGLSSGHVVAEFVQGTDMDALAALGRPPVGHWTEGQEILSAYHGRGLVYEFVSPGCHKHHSYYRDTVPFEEQITILFHVAGHYHFSNHSRFAQVRTIDLPREAMELYTLMDSLYAHEDHDEVSEWYQYLLSLSYMQDVSRGTYDSVESLSPSNSQRQLRHPKAATASVLQAFVANLPNTLPPWKKEVARRFERIHRYYSGAAPTKIMNEGWAALMQELLAEHTPYATLRYALSFDSFMKGVAYPSLSNPYWIGREAWRRIRTKFNERPEMQGLTPLDRDTRFIAYATKEFIEKYDDFDFIQAALDDQWVRDKKLVLSRAAQWHEISGQLPQPPGHLKNPEPKVVVTNDPARIVRHIARSNVDLRFRIPRLELQDLNAKGTGVVSLGFSDEVGRYLPLERHSMVQTLFVMSQIIERPMSLQTRALSDWLGFVKPLQNEDPQLSLPGMPTPRWSHWDWPPQPQQPESVPLRVVVEPSGAVRAYKVNEKNVEELNEPLSQELQEAVEFFKRDLAISENDALQQARSRYQAVAQQAATQLANVAPVGLFAHALTATRSIMEYHRMVKRRMSAMIEAALKGDSSIRRTKNGVRIRVLPFVPSLRFDSRALKLLSTNVDVGTTNLRNQVSVRMQTARTLKGPFTPDDDLEPTVSSGKPGDIYWGEGHPPDSDGDGDEDSEGDKDGERGPPGTPPGDGGFDPSYIDLPLDLYGRLLAENIELPRLKPKTGLINHKDTEEEGFINRRTGLPVYPRMVRRIFQLGLNGTAQGTANNLQQRPSEVFLRGLRGMKSHDWIVKDEQKTKSPEYNALVVIAVDMSGSMMGDPLSAAKKMAFDLRALLLAKYQQVEFRFVAFDGAGHVFENADDFFKANLGGGTDYRAGLQKVLEVERGFPRSKWDRYVVGIGDLEDGADLFEVMNLVREVTNESEYTSMVGMGSWAAQTPLGSELKNYAQQEQWFGYADIEEPGAYHPSVFRKLFKNEK